MKKNVTLILKINQLMICSILVLMNLIKGLMLIYKRRALLTSHILSIYYSFTLVEALIIGIMNAVLIFAISKLNIKMDVPVLHLIHFAIVKPLSKHSMSYPLSDIFPEIKLKMST